jgi:hypothetical protein
VSVSDTKDLQKLDAILYSRPAGRNIIGFAIDEIKRLRAERDRLAAQLTICKQQADQGLEVEHDCPATYACACIYVELATDEERAAIEAAIEGEP